MCRFSKNKRQKMKTIFTEMEPDRILVPRENSSVQTKFGHEVLAKKRFQLCIVITGTF